MTISHRHVIVVLLLSINLCIDRIRLYLYVHSFVWGGARFGGPVFVLYTYVSIETFGCLC